MSDTILSQMPESVKMVEPASALYEELARMKDFDDATRSVTLSAEDQRDLGLLTNLSGATVTNNADGSRTVTLNVQDASATPEAGEAGVKSVPEASDKFAQKGNATNASSSL